MMATIWSHYNSYSDAIREIKKNTATLIICNTLIAAGSGLTAPLFVRYLEALGATPSIIGSIEGLNYLLYCHNNWRISCRYLWTKKNNRDIIHLIILSRSALVLSANTWIWAIPGVILLGGRVLI
jgi:DHA1 family multidrug resistance protein-like MFS transporter